MKYAELKKQSAHDLQRLLAETRESLRKACFSVSQKQLKNVRTIRVLKKTIAQIATHLKIIKAL